MTYPIGPSLTQPHLLLAIALPGQSLKLRLAPVHTQLRLNFLYHPPSPFSSQATDFHILPLAFFSLCKHLILFIWRRSFFLFRSGDFLFFLAKVFPFKSSAVSKKLPGSSNSNSNFTAKKVFRKKTFLILIVLGLHGLVFVLRSNLEIIGFT